MDFTDKIKTFSQRVSLIKDTVLTEEATKTSMVLPFFQILGYDVFDPNEFVPEYVSDIGTKKGEKVDYAIFQNNIPIILIEAKNVNENLDKHGNQLYRYFSVTKAKFAILTNGICYQFYTDLDETNKMDEKPFLEINILEIKDNSIYELKRFQKDCFNEKEIFNIASELKYSNEIKKKILYQFTDPDDEFCNYILSQIYLGKKTQSAINKFKPIIKKTLNYLITELINEKINNVFLTDIQEKNDGFIFSQDGKIITTKDEIDAFYIVQKILYGFCKEEDVTFKDTESYFNVLYKGNTRKWICRFVFTNNTKFIIFPVLSEEYSNKKKEIEKIEILNLTDITNYTDKLVTIVKKYFE